MSEAPSLSVVPVNFLCPIVIFFFGVGGWIKFASVSNYGGLFPHYLHPEPNSSNSRHSQILHPLCVFFLLGWVLFLFLLTSWPQVQWIPVIWLYQSPSRVSWLQPLPCELRLPKQYKQMPAPGSQLQACLRGKAITNRGSGRTAELKRLWSETSQPDPNTSITH